MTADRKCEDWLTSYLEYTQFLEAPDIFHWWTGVSVIAGALRRNVFFDQSYYRWTPNFYIILVAPSGVIAKSTTMGNGMRLLRELSYINFGVDNLTWQYLVPLLNDSAEGIQQPDGSFEQVSCLTFASSELGMLLDPEDRGMADFLTHLWDGQDSFTKGTKYQGVEMVAKPWINIIACTTPSWISEHLTRHFIGGGLMSRCVFIYADKKRRLVAYPRKEINKQKSGWMQNLRANLVEDLRTVSSLSGEYVLSPEADEIGEKWYEKLNHEITINPSLAEFDGYVARKQGHAHKLAMVLSASRHNRLVIDARELDAAIKMLEVLEADMGRTFSGIDATRIKHQMEVLVRTLEIKKKISQSELLRLFVARFGMGAREFGDLLSTAVNARWARTEQHGTQIIVIWRGKGEEE